MKQWIKQEDGDYLNSAFIQELRLQENDDSIGTFDTHFLVAVTLRQHEEVAHIIRTGSLIECKQELDSIFFRTSS